MMHFSSCLPLYHPNKWENNFRFFQQICSFLLSIHTLDSLDSNTFTVMTAIHSKYNFQSSKIVWNSVKDHPRKYRTLSAIYGRTKLYQPFGTLFIAAASPSLNLILQRSIVLLFWITQYIFTCGHTTTLKHHLIFHSQLQTWSWKSVGWHITVQANKIA